MNEAFTLVLLILFRTVLPIESLTPLDVRSLVILRADGDFAALLAEINGRAGSLDPRGPAWRSLAEQLAKLDKQAVNEVLDADTAWQLARKDDSLSADARMTAFNTAFTAYADKGLGDGVLAVALRIAHGREMLRSGRTREGVDRLLKAYSVASLYYGAEGGLWLARVASDIGKSLHELGRDEEALPFLEAALKTYVDERGMEDYATSIIQNQMGLVLLEIGLLSRAEQAFRASIAARMVIFGPNDPRNILPESNLIGVLVKLGAYLEAEYKSVRLLGRLDDSPSTAHLRAHLHGHLCSIYLQQYLPNEAIIEGKACVEAALELPETRFGLLHGRCHSRLANALGTGNKIAEACAEAEKAERLFSQYDSPDSWLLFGVRANLRSWRAEANNESPREALTKEHESAKSNYVAGHPNRIRAARLLADCYVDEGDTAAAFEVLSEACAEAPSLSSENASSSTAASWQRLAEISYSIGRNSETVQAAAAAAAWFDWSSARLIHAGLEGFEFAESRSPYLLLAAAQANMGASEAAWNSIERSFSRTMLLAKSKYQGSPPEPEERAHLQRIAAAEEAAVRQPSQSRESSAHAKVAYRHYLARRSAGTLLQSALPFDYRELQRGLPDSTALVCWLDVEIEDADRRESWDHWVLVLRSQGLPICRRIPGTGPGGTWTKEDADLAEMLVSLISIAPQQRERDQGRTLEQLLDRLSKQRFAPILDVLAETESLPRASRIVVVTNGWMSLAPVDLLVQDRSVTYAPSFTLHAQSRAAASNAKRNLLNGVLLLGSTDFESVGVSRGSTTTVFGRKVSQLGDLSSVPAELQSAADSLRKVSGTILIDSNVTESRLRELFNLDLFAPASLVHLATHTLVDPDDPLEIAVVVAATNVASPFSKTDGVIFLKEVLREWRLDAALVVLAACRSGSGVSAGNEGIVGIGTGLLARGAREVLVSSWDLPDAPTALIMGKFYSSLADGKSPAESLELAKRWVQELSISDAIGLLGRMKSVTTRGDQAIQSAGVLADPYYWAGLRLIGGVD